MKKIVGIGTLVACLLALGACGSDSSNNSESSSSSVSSEIASSETKSGTKQKTSDTIFEDDSSKIVIKNTEELTNKFDSNKKILAIEIEFTNKSEDAQSPWFAFASSIKPIQETEKTEELLNGANGQFPEDYKPELVKMGDTDVKSGATVEAVVGLDIIYPGSPVIMKDFMDTGVFEKTVETTK